MILRDLPGVSAMSVVRPPVSGRARKIGATGRATPGTRSRRWWGAAFACAGRHENVYTMAANAVLRLDPAERYRSAAGGLPGIGTESSTDNAAGAVIVRGMVDRALESLGMPRLSRHLRGARVQARVPGRHLRAEERVALRSVRRRRRLAIVVCADVAEYERGSTGEQTQGAGAVAMLVEREAKLFEVDLQHAGSASDYRGPDFRKPFARHFTKAMRRARQRMSDFPVFSGKYSTFSYLDETVQAVEDMLRKLNVSAGKYYDSVHSLFFHRPYEMMPVQAMSFLYVRGMARGDHHHDELRALVPGSRRRVRGRAERDAIDPGSFRRAVSR